MVQDYEEHEGKLRIGPQGQQFSAYGKSGAKAQVMDQKVVQSAGSVWIQGMQVVAPV